MRRSVSAGLWLLWFFHFCPTSLSAQSIQLSVDLSDAPRNIYHSRLTIPVKPGPLTLVYPKWIPGNHRPSGPIANVTGIKMEAGGQTLAWQRDPVDMYAFHVIVPAGANELQVSLDTITDDGSAGATGPSATTHVLDLNWNQVVLYPQGASSDEVEVSASVGSAEKLEVWDGASNRPAYGSGSPDNSAFFKPVTLTTLVDSPLIAGDHYRRIELTKPGETPVHVIDMVSESEAGLAMTPADEAAYRKLVAETGALFGARHYLEYHFLLTLSDDAGHHGVEHHQSSDNSVGERTLLDSDLHLTGRGPAAARVYPFVEWQIPATGGIGHAQLSGSDGGRSAVGVRGADRVSRKCSDGALRAVDAGAISRSSGGNGGDARPSRRTDLASARGHGAVGANSAVAGAGVAELAARPRLLSRGRTDLAGGGHDHPAAESRGRSR